jgi:hypothetical protein
MRQLVGVGGDVVEARQHDQAEEAGIRRAPRLVRGGFALRLGNQGQRCVTHDPSVSARQDKISTPLHSAVKFHDEAQRAFLAHCASTLVQTPDGGFAAASPCADMRRRLFAIVLPPGG